MDKSVLSIYHFSFEKRLLDIFIAGLGVIILFPLFCVISLMILVFSGYPIFFKQKRSGLNGKPFYILKFRTMKNGAERVQYRYKELNEADGPVFKIYNDPRFTKIGKALSRTGLDELPQLINVLKGDMSLVGPRPLPIREAQRLTKEQKVRELVKPGVTSLWVIKGSHILSFKEWMELDKKYVKSACLSLDMEIIYKTFLMLLKLR